MVEALSRAGLLPEPELPETAALIAEGRRLARGVTLGRSAFLDHYGVASEAEYKRNCVAEGRVMLHAHIGFRDAAKTARACAEIWEALDRRGYRVDRFGLCFDRNMGYLPAERADMPRGTGLILDGPEEYEAVARAAPAAPHFGDFMIGQPAAVENVIAALECGATTMGNVGQYFSYRLLYRDDEIAQTAATVTALALIAAHPAEVLVTSNLDDGFGPLFSDLACGLGMLMIEQYVVDELIGARLVPVFGNMFADPLHRVAFQRAVARIGTAPGPMVYGSTTVYGSDDAANWAGLASYLAVDIAAQRLCPSGHAVTPVPVTEYERIPDTNEIVEVHLFANRLIEETEKSLMLFDPAAADEVADRLVAGGERFKRRVLAGLAEAGIDVADPFELLLALRRAGARRLEALYGPGAEEAARVRGRRPLVPAAAFAELEAQGAMILESLDPALCGAISGRGLVACVGTTDVHEYGKILVETVLAELGVGLIDGGVSADPTTLAARARDGGADFIALSTYNGIALSYITSLRRAMAEMGLDVPVYLGGRLNQIPEGSNTSLPVEVSAELNQAGARVCADVAEMLGALVAPPADRAA